MNEPYYIENTIQKFVKKAKEKYKGQETELEKILKEKLPIAIKRHQ